MKQVDYKALIENLLERDSAQTGRDRVTIYHRVKSTLETTLDKFDPPLSARDRTSEVRKLANAIRTIEAEIQASAPTAAERAAAEPAGIWLTPLPAASAVAPPPVPLSPLHVVQDRLRIIFALIVRQVYLASSRDRSYYLWLIVEAFFQVGFVIIGYLFLNREYVLDMPAPAFAVSGTASWLMFRTTVRISVSAEANGNIFLPFFPKVCRFDVVVAQTFFVAIFYLSILAIFLGCIRYAGYVYHLNNLFAFLAWWIAMWMFGTGVGFGGSALAERFEWGRKAVQLTLRIMMIFSGVAIVTEQLPEDYRVYFLWNPIIHGVQFMRSALFVEYQTEDASLPYFMYTSLLLVAIGLAADLSVRLRKL